MVCKNCQGGCIHYQIEDKKKKIEYKDEKGVVWMTGWESDGYRHYCDKNPDGFDKWYEEHKHDTYDVYKDSVMECYEPTETNRLLNEMLEMSNKILKDLKK